MKAGAYQRAFKFALSVSAALCLLAGGAMAADYYVTPTGAGSTNGANWHNAISNVQAAVNLAATAGDTIYLQAGVWSNSASLVISNKPGVTIRGGCNGLAGGGSNDYSGTNSTLTRSGGTIRIVSGQSSTLTVANVTVRGGYFSSGANYGAGLFFTNCDVTLTNCAVRDNTNTSSGVSYGGGLYAAGGALTVLDSTFQNNRVVPGAATAGHGGGIAAVNCALSVSGGATVFSNNTVYGASVGASTYGGAIYATNGPLTLANALLVGNWTTSAWNYAVGGGAVYHAGGGGAALITGCAFVDSSAYADNGGGGALYLAGATGVIANCGFTNSTVSANQVSYAGCLYADRLQSLQVLSNDFRNSWGWASAGSRSYGGTFYLRECSNAVVDGCTLDGAEATAGKQPELVYVNGGGNTYLLNSTLRNNNAGGGLYFAFATNSALWMSNSLVAGNNGSGLAFASGRVTLMNCLLARNVGDGLALAGGTATVANCTLANNGGWGLSRSGGTGTVFNSIAWDNFSGGIASNADMWVDFCCSQSPAFGGASNFCADPLFASVRDSYYLSVSGLTGQAASSPCIAAGSNTAAAWGLTNRTTRTDGAGDTNAPVDLGYHYAAGVATSDIRTVTNCCVDAASGTDTNSGASWGAAWKSLTHALSNVAADATIHVAAGTYDAANGEAFPLTVQMPNLTLAATNSDPALTVVDNEGAVGRRVLQAAGKQSLLLRGLTFRGGRFGTGQNFGAGLMFQSCLATLTNCAVRDNTNICTVAESGNVVYGGGVYAAGGSLTVVDSTFHNNRVQPAGCGYGGGIAAVNCTLTVRGSAGVFSNNAVYSTSAYSYGGAISVTNGQLTLANALLVGNSATSGWNFTVGGGAVFHAGTGMSAAITGCVFVNSSTYADGGGGGALYLAGATGVIANCGFTNSTAGGNNGSSAGCLYADRLQSLQVLSCDFYNSRSWAYAVSYSYGGTFYLRECSNTVVDGCTLDGAGVPATRPADMVYVSRGGNTYILNSALQSNNAGRGLYFAGTNSAALWMNNSRIAGNNGHGLTFAGMTGSQFGATNCLFVDNKAQGLNFSNGTAALFNCLAARNVQDGIGLAAGAVSVANCTLIDNGGWGLSRSGGTGTVVNSIAWDNFSGGIASNADMWVDFCCSQSPVSGGASNYCADPLFASVADCYYLSVSGLTGQAASSPCIAAGSNTAAAWGLTNRTTRTDGAGDTNEPVDLGYHYAAGVSTSAIRVVTNCYVDAASGANTNSGASWGAAWKSLTHALGRVAADATIHAAAGTYDAANGEAFPLTVQMPGLTLAATNADPAQTVVDNAGTNGQRVLQAVGKKSLLLRGLTFRGGRFAVGENNGAGLLLQSCAATLTNCAVRDNTNSCTTGPAFGGGVYAAGGTLAILDSAFLNNTLSNAAQNNYGAGLAAISCALTVRGGGCVFSNNTINGLGNPAGQPYGGAIYATNVSLTLDGAVFATNWVHCSWHTASGGGGGAVYHIGNDAVATVTGCQFTGNGVRNNAYGGGALCFVGASGTVAGCTFAYNSTTPEHPDAWPHGGAICAINLQQLAIGSSVFQDNQGSKGGGTLYLTSCSNVVVDGCAIDSANVPTGRAPEQVYLGGVGTWLLLNSTLRNNNAGRGLRCGGVAGGAMLALTNCLLARNAGDGMLISSGAATVVNCTLANNVGWGIARPVVAELTVKNSIVWGNTYGGIGHNQNLTLTYTDTQDGWAAGLGPGNMSADPLFVDPAGGDYHEMGVEGSYHNGAWAPDSRNSPCLDAGDPASDWSQEPKPCGNRINAGAYGNTAEATRSLPKVGTVLRVW